MNFGGRTDEGESIQIIDRAIDAGINFLDTANVYSRGESERVTGKALRSSGKRDQIVLATKVYGKMADEDPNMKHPTRRHIIQQCEASLGRLQTDWIDLYQIHRPINTIPIDETLRALDDLVRSGKVRYIGTSTFPAWQMLQSLWVSKELGLNRFVCEQPPYHLLDRRIEREVVPMAQTYGIGLIPWSPLAGGFLTGKYERGGGAIEGARHRDMNNPRVAALLTSDATFGVLDLLEAIANDRGCTISQVALAWNMGQPGITSPIIGPRTMEQLEDNLGALGVALTEQDLSRIDQVAEPGRAILPWGQADWEPPAHRVV
jgi:aryl-alcohol dehydrogenase-like predicted oxidoreductase